MLAAFASPAAHGSSFTTLGNFPSGSDGPFAAVGTLIRYRGALFGSLWQGGGQEDRGGVFKVYIKSGKVRILHVFTGVPDGSGPYASLTEMGGRLYGTTIAGGKKDGGTIYAVDPVTGRLDLVHQFQEVFGDESGPFSNLVPYGSTLIGTTYFGSQRHEDGTIYQFDPVTGKFTTLYAFGKGSQDGRNPQSPPLVVGDKLYGVNVSGGEGYYEGTLYEYDFNNGHERVLFDFGGAIGYEPASNLVKVGGGLYGVTGNEVHDNPPLYGTMYRWDIKARTMSLVHGFAGHSKHDGASPVSGIIYTRGLIYGTTNAGGTHDLGTIYAVNPATGAEQVLYSFKGTADGGEPAAGLLESHGVFYGTTISGGAHGAGTVFSFTP